MKRILFFVCGLAIAAAAQAQIISIPYDYPAIQLGINAASPGDTVLAEPGYYVENIDFCGKNIVVASLFLVTGDTTYIDETIIDGNQEGSVVTFGNNEDLSALLCGFTIVNGHAYHAGGIHICQASPTLRNLKIKDNSAYYSGGGICCGYSEVIIQNVEISNNYALVSGGGMYFYFSTPKLNNVSVSYCWSDDCGGGIYSENSTFDIVNLSVNNNYSVKGGGMSFKNSTLLLVNGLINNNLSEILGGGIKLENTSALLINTVIADNYSEMVAGGIYCLGSNPVLTNVTLVNNSSFECGGGIYCNEADVTCNNSIFWGNLPDEVYFELSTNADQISFSYCNVQNGEDDIITNNNGIVNWIIGNIANDPQFIGSGKAPYSLSNGSPCIDAGTPDVSGLNLPVTDLAGNQRVWDGDEDGITVIDMGPYEYGSMIVGIANPLSLESKIGIQNYPNPFSGVTTFEYELKEPEMVTISVLDHLGHLVSLFTINCQSTGMQHVTWNAENLSAGLYFYIFSAGQLSETGKMIILK